MNKAAVPIETEVLKHYERLVATLPNVERKGATMPYASLNGHMFSFLTKAGTLALRLPAEEREAVLKKFKAKLCEQNGAVLKEYGEIPEALLPKTQELKKLFAISYNYVASLKPKPTKRRRK